MKVKQIKAANGYNYLDAPQKSPEWVKVRVGKVTASRLGDWLATSKRDGKPLKARLDYERELAYERQFNTEFSTYVTGAMALGIEYEPFMAEQYEKIYGVTVDTCGAFYNEHFVASPDRLVGDDGLLEIKVLGDASFAQVLDAGVPEAHYLQIQGQLLASGRKWCDYVAGNLDAKKVKVIRVEPDAETFKRIKASLPEVDGITNRYSDEGLYSFVDELKLTTDDQVWV